MRPLLQAWRKSAHMWIRGLLIHQKVSLLQCIHLFFSIVFTLYSYIFIYIWFESVSVGPRCRCAASAAPSHRGGPHWALRSLQHLPKNEHDMIWYIYYLKENIDVINVIILWLFSSISQWVWWIWSKSLFEIVWNHLKELGCQAQTAGVHGRQLAAERRPQEAPHDVDRPQIILEDFDFSAFPILTPPKPT